MLKTTWKPEEEIRQSLAGSRSLGIVSCGFCAYLSGTGGPEGVLKMRRLARKWDKHVLFGRVISPCCSKEVMESALAAYLAPVRSRCDALVMLSCAAGVKTAFLARPGTRVVAVLDSMGSQTIAAAPDPVASSLCVGCGQCVLTYTAGICPVSACTAHRKYGPCPKAPERGGPCALDPDRTCPWHVILERSDPVGLQKLARIQKEDGTPAFPPDPDPRLPGWARRAAAWAMAHSGPFSRFVHLIR